MCKSGCLLLTLEPAAADRLARGVKGSGGVAATVVDTPEGGAKGRVEFSLQYES